MSDIMRVDMAAMQHASDSINSALRALQSQLDQVERDAEPLVKTWEGDAQVAYRERQKKWQDAAAQLSTMLRDIHRALNDSTADYARTERSNTSMFPSAS